MVTEGGVHHSCQSQKVFDVRKVLKACSSRWGEEHTELGDRDGAVLGVMQEEPAVLMQEERAGRSQLAVL